MMIKANPRWKGKEHPPHIGIYDIVCDHCYRIFTITKEVADSGEYEELCPSCYFTLTYEDLETPHDKLKAPYLLAPDD